MNASPVVEYQSPNVHSRLRGRCVLYDEGAGDEATGERCVVYLSLVMTRRPSSSSPTTLPGDSTPTDVIDVSVVIVNYNVREFLEQALRSVRRASEDLATEVFVVDNNSVDGSIEMVRSSFPDVHVIANERNVGFSTANNQAIRKAKGRYLFILNPDTIVQEDTLTTLVRFMDEHPDAGAVGCKILNPDGTFALESRRAFPTPRVAFFRMVGLSRLFPRSRRFGRYNLTYLPVDSEAEVDALSGSCMLVRHAALYASRDEWKNDTPETSNTGEKASRADLSFDGFEDGAGLFDENFFMYGEDLDWCYRIQQAGWSIHYTPSTQIIHYKGESTKKGELRYVRLFYGAMLRFAEKHFHDRYSGLFVALLRLGVLVRAGLTLLTNAVRRLMRPVLDAVLIAATVALLGVLRSAQVGVAFSPLFYAVVAPLYAVMTVASIAALGGYRHSRRTRLLPPWLGAALGLLGISALSFFARDIAFSRAVVLASFPVSAGLMTLVRLAQQRRRRGPRRAVLVGHAAEACRLHAMLATHHQPPFELVGYVESNEARRNGAQPGTGEVPRLGTLRHLRDLVRLRRIDDVVFAADRLSNRIIFRLMQQLRDLPVQSRILGAGHAHIIGKASIDHLTTPALIEAEEAIGAPRGTTSRRAFELGVSLLGLLAYPFARVAASLSGRDSFAHRLAERLRALPAVLSGRRALVGYHATPAFEPPPEWDLRPGVFAVTDTLTTAHPTAEAVNQAYWFYVRNQSAALDWTIIVRAIRNLKG